jgi:hypothetical protein
MIPYRFRHSLRKCLTALLWVAVICGVFFLCWLLWLNRYIIYTRDGAKLDFDQSPDYPQGELAVPPTVDTTVNIYFDDGSQTPDADNTELKQLSGVYVTGNMLSGNFDAVAQQLKALPAGSTIMLDVKSIHGKFYYTTDLGPGSTVVPTQQMSQLIAQLQRSGHYLIAKMPAFRDYYYALDHVSSGIYNKNRKSLWLDPDRTYWLNPAKEDILSYLWEIITELRLMGFDEVVLSDFSVPQNDYIYYDADPAEVIQKAANALSAIASDTFAVSFLVTDPTFPIPEGRSRLYFADVAAANAASTAAATGIAETDKRIVFLTNLMDTRYDPYSVLRPLELT